MSYRAGNSRRRRAKAFPVGVARAAPHRGKRRGLAAVSFTAYGRMGRRARCHHNRRGGKRAGDSAAAFGSRNSESGGGRVEGAVSSPSRSLRRNRPRCHPDSKIRTQQAPQIHQQPSKLLENPTPPPPNAIPYGAGGAPTVPATSFAMGPGAAKAGVSFSGRAEISARAFRGTSTG